MISANQIHWIAGLLEGEGTFNFANMHLKRGRSIRIALSMTDRDVVERLANLLGFGYIYKIQMRKYGLKAKLQHRWECSGSCAGLMMTIYPLLGERRQARIRELLNYWKSTRPSGRGIAAKKVFSFDSIGG